MPANMLTAKPGLGAALCESTTPKPDLGLAGIEFGALKPGAGARPEIVGMPAGKGAPGALVWPARTPPAAQTSVVSNK